MLVGIVAFFGAFHFPIPPRFSYVPLDSDPTISLFIYSTANSGGFFFRDFTSTPRATVLLAS